jgi:hypothetical protein
VDHSSSFFNPLLAVATAESFVTVRRATSDTTKGVLVIER